MKTIEELFEEVKKDEKLKEEGIAAIQAGKLGALMKAHGCEASEKEALAFVKAKAEKAGIPLFFL
jgi:hypothetical protein